MDYSELLSYCKAMALANALEPTENTVWRSICRKYSSKFATPLHEVFELDPEFVTLHYFEDQMDDVDVEEKLEGLLETIYGMQDPEYEKQKNDELKNFIKESEREETARLKAGKPIHKALKNEETLKPKDEILPMPTSGGINMSYFDEENER